MTKNVIIAILVLAIVGMFYRYSKLLELEQLRTDVMCIDEKLILKIDCMDPILLNLQRQAEEFSLCPGIEDT